MCDFGTLLGQLSWVCADPSPSLPGDMLAHSAAWASRAAPSRLPHLALFSSHPRVTALLVQRCCSHPLPPTLHPSGNATRAALVEVSPQPPLHTRPTALLCAGRAGSAPPHSQDGCCQFWGGYVGLSLVTPPWDCTDTVPTSLYGHLCCGSSHFLSWQGLGLRGVSGPAYSL